MKEKISRKTFVQLGALLGVGAAGASMLAACGGKSGGGGSNDGPGGGGYGGQLDTGGYSEGSLGEKSDRSVEKQQVSGGQGDGRGGGDPVRTPDKKSVRRAENKQASDKQAIVRTSEVRPGTALAFEDSGGNPAVLVRLRSGNFVAYSALCPHEGCAVAYSNGQLACPCHGSIFDPANDARVVNGPARRPLPKIPVEVRGEDVVGT